MRRPLRQWDQLVGKAHAEAARGSGLWPLQPHPCELEPHWEPFERTVVTPFECWLNRWNSGWEPSLLRRCAPWIRPVLAEGEHLTLPKWRVLPSSAFDAIQIATYSEEESTLSKTQEFLRSLRSTVHPICFELIGLGEQPQYAEGPVKPRSRLIVKAARIPSRGAPQSERSWSTPVIVMQMVAHRTDAPQIESQLVAQFPHSAVVRDRLRNNDPLSPIFESLKNGHGAGTSLSLRHYYLWLLRTVARQDTDPLGVALAAMEQLERQEWSLLQILLVPARNAWADSFEKAVADPYKASGYLLPGATGKLIAEKFSSPLFAVSVRLAACRDDLLRNLLGWADQFALPPQELVRLDDSESEAVDLSKQAIQLFATALENRCTFRPGILLNLEELAGLMHVPSPSIVSERLCRVTTRTRAVPSQPLEPGGVVLGDNIHRGKAEPACLSRELRFCHCYVAGASGTGKSTLLLNMILQDVQSGQGCAVLDPHGDLITAVLERVPPHRFDDVILFDPADDQYPFPLNIIESKDESERERIVSETVMALKRYFPTSWGPRLQQILTFALYTVLEAVPGATLADVERLLTVPRFREEAVGRLRTNLYADFWKYQFLHYPRNAVDPVLNKLSVFLVNSTVRNIICQRHSAIDFDVLLNSGKILLANLSTGLLTEELSGTLGSFLVTKIINAAFRRARVPESERRPFYFYVDELQAYMNVSVGFDRILAEARKQRLILIAANQFIGQLSADVRLAIFGNVETKVVFRLGVDDANSLAREMGIFTADEILNLGRGEALVRAGIASNTFNVRTYPAPPPSKSDGTDLIRRRTREQLARPRSIVEAELGVQLPQRAGLYAMPADEPTDPNEDDLVR